MYCACKFSGTWSFYDGHNKISRLLTPIEITCVEALFSTVLQDNVAMLCALQIEKVAPNRLKRLLLFIGCFPDKWFIHNQRSKSTLELSAEQIRQLKALMPNLLEETDEPLFTLQISALPLTKLMHLPIAGTKAVDNPTFDTASKQTGK